MRGGGRWNHRPGEGGGPSGREMRREWGEPARSPSRFPLECVPPGNFFFSSSHHFCDAEHLLHLSVDDAASQTSELPPPPNTHTRTHTLLLEA